MWGGGRVKAKTIKSQILHVATSARTDAEADIKVVARFI